MKPTALTATVRNTSLTPTLTSRRRSLAVLLPIAAADGVDADRQDAPESPLISAIINAPAADHDRISAQTHALAAALLQLGPQAERLIRHTSPAQARVDAEA